MGQSSRHTELIIGVGQVSLYLRHARTLKDKRQVVKSFAQKLRNQGFSVTEFGSHENAKLANLGFTYAGHSHSEVEQIMDDALRAFIGDFEIISRDVEVSNYAERESDAGRFQALDEDEFSK